MTDNTRTILGHIVDMIPTLRELDRVLAERHRTDSRDGYPTSSLAGGNHAGGHADPVGDLIQSRAARPDADPIAGALHGLGRDVQAAFRLLEKAVNRGKAVLEPTVALDNAGDWCVSCSRIGVANPVVRNGRCRRCAEWRNANNGEEISADLLRELGKGQRLTTRLVSRFYPEDAPVWGRQAQ